MTNTDILYEKLIQAFEEKIKDVAFQIFPTSVPGHVGGLNEDDEVAIEVTNQPGFIYVYNEEEHIQAEAMNWGVPLILECPVLIYNLRNTYWATVDPERFAEFMGDEGTYNIVAWHTHNDPTLGLYDFVQTLRIQVKQVQHISGVIIRLLSAFYLHTNGTSIIYYDENDHDDIDLASYQPAGGMRKWVVVGVDKLTGEPAVLEGSEIVATIDIHLSEFEEFDFTDFEIWVAINLYGQTTLVYENLYDIKPWASYPGVASGSGGSGDSYWLLSGDSGTIQQVGSGELVQFIGGEGIDTFVSDVNLLTIKFDINGLTAEATIDPSADYLAMFDASVSAHRKILIEDLPSGSHTHPSSDITDFAEAVDDRVAALFTPGDDLEEVYDDPSNTYLLRLTHRQQVVCGGRLTISSSDPVPSSTNGTTFYYLPYIHNALSIYDGSRWVVRTFTAPAFAGSPAQIGTRTNGSAIITGLTNTGAYAVGMKVSGTGIPGASTVVSIDTATQITISANATSSGSDLVTGTIPVNTNFDVFAVYDGSNVALRIELWSSDITRSVGLTRLDGVYVQSGTTTRRYLGTIRTTFSDGTFEDTEDTRMIWNYYNRVGRELNVNDNTSHAYGSTTIRAWQNNVAKVNRVDCVIGVIEEPIEIGLWSAMTENPSSGFVGLGHSSSTVNIGNGASIPGGQSTDSDGHRVGGMFSIMPTIGYQYFQVTERGNASGSGPTFSAYYLTGTVKG